MLYGCTKCNFLKRWGFKLEILLNTGEKVNAKFLKVNAKIRYWEDANVNSVEDVHGTIPFRKGAYWCPLIDIDNGMVVGWPGGISANIHYEVCDDGEYVLLDEDLNDIIKLEGYVPSIMRPEVFGYEDYIIMNIDKLGFINKWNKAAIREFQE